MATNHLTIRAVSATAVAVPMKRPLGTSARSIETASLLLIDLETHEGVTGHGYAWCYLPSIARSLLPVVAELSAALAGLPVEPLELAGRMARHFRLPGLVGPLAMVASSIDTAAWDAASVAAGLPLARYLGAAPRPIPAYNSNGLGLMDPQAAADEAEELLDGGFHGVKLRLGRADFDHDMAAVRAVRRRLPDRAHLMVDFNQALTYAQAMRYCLALDGEGVYWIEEPIRHDDYRHLAILAETTATPIQIGENFAGLAPMAAALASGACDYAMLDLDRIGGVTGWVHAAGLAASYGREISSHLFPEVSAHLLAATPTRHWLEYVDWAVPILAEPLKIVDGMAVLADRPGAGLQWDPSAVEKYRLT